MYIEWKIPDTQDHRAPESSHHLLQLWPEYSSLASSSEPRESYPWIIQEIYCPTMLKYIYASESPMLKRYEGLILFF